MSTDKINVSKSRVQFLKRKDPRNLTEKERAEINAYNELNDELKHDAIKNYIQSIREEVNKPEQVFQYPTKEQLYFAFLKRYKDIYKKKFIINETTIGNIAPIILYFCQDKSFFDSPQLIKNEIDFGGVKKISNPSFNKGLMIIGNYGNGKSSIMYTIGDLLKYTPIGFRQYTANEVVDMYEECANPSDKALFWKKMQSWRALFDDVKTEREASNYGKTNIFKDVFEKRNANQNCVTFVSMNYHSEYPNDLKKALLEIGSRYGGRVFDRVFEDFNIIEFKGNSMRN